MTTKTFFNSDFLLESPLAIQLFENFAKNTRIIDYHCHLEARDIYQNESYSNLSELWLEGDHYKWRLMRAYGIEEKYITGDATDYEKFLKWAIVCETLIGNPVYHWCHLELKRFFNIDEVLNEKNAKVIYDKANELIKNIRSRDFIINSKVDIICTTDDPLDDLHYHKLLKQEEKRFQVLPSFRPDSVLNIEFNDNFLTWINKLAKITSVPITSLVALENALEKRVIYFNEVGCKVADCAFDFLVYESASTAEVEIILSKALKKETLTQIELAKYKGYILTFLGKLYHKYNWAQQLHIGAYRNASTRRFLSLGINKGFDVISDGNIALPLIKILDEQDKTNQLPRTIIYTLNAKDFDSAISIMGAFQDSGINSKLQFGSGWWFQDTIVGMTKQMTSLANNGAIAHFVGMLTDSRSFLSYPRHEYFRRILCNFVADQVNKGLFPNDMTTLGKIIENICYNNAKNYFGF